MANTLSYFNFVPDFEYVNRFPNAKLSKYIKSKNIFTNIKIRDEIFQDLMYFEKYTIIADERPDNVAETFYEDPDLDWLVLLSNNIVNVYEEWPLTQKNFEEFVLDKYGSFEKLNEIKYYKSKEVTNSRGLKILEKDLIVPENYSVTFFDPSIGREITKSGITIPVTNLDLENELQEKRRNIFLIKPEYRGLVIDQINTDLKYKRGSTQFVSRTLKRGDNIRLYQ